MSHLNLQFDISFNDLHTPSGLKRLDDNFDRFLKECNNDLYDQYKIARLHKKSDSVLLLSIAPIVEDFLASLFSIEKEVQDLQKEHHKLAHLYTCKRTFIQRKVAKKGSEEGAELLDGDRLRSALAHYFNIPIQFQSFDDLTYATHVLKWLQTSDRYQTELKLANDYGVWALFTKEGQVFHKGSSLFQLPQKRKFDNLVPDDIAIHKREGFKLTDVGISRSQALGQTNYCIFCHDRNKDSCSTGLKSKKESNVFEKNPLGRHLEGCPLDEKVSEMNQLKSQGFSLAALCVVTIDNPLVAATGHRICNDCVAACIYQKQDPVDIPGIETQNLRDVLSLPWGFEIYALLTRWNPLRFESPLPKESTGGRALVVGMGPAGFTLSHYLLQEGHSVVGVDGLKIEPLPQAFITDPIKNSALLFENLDERIIAGFGGVAEYGITVRWDKNFLKIIRLLLERRDNFLLQGGVRFGSTMTPDQVFKDFEFDHVALCAGAGQPNLIPIKNVLARGVRLASDFLMALQLTGAAKKSSISNLELRLPAVVIGGGLTAIDTATEALAYYPIQVEKFLKRYEALGISVSDLSLDDEQKQVAETWLEHGRILRQERKKENPDILKHLQSWGGVTVLYRKTLKESPSYRLNHEEVFKALQEGIQFAGEVTPKEIMIDKFGHAQGVLVEKNEQDAKIPARSIFIAAGTKPNVTLSKEYPDLFELDGVHYKSYGIENVLIATKHSKYSIPIQFRNVDLETKAELPDCTLVHEDNDDLQFSKTHILKKDRYMSYFGDLHPTYKGNVVKAMASAKNGYSTISKLLKTRKNPQKEFLEMMKQQLSATVHQVNRLTPTITEVIVKAPLAVKNFKPGQFYRLQNFESLARCVLKTTLTMEGLALTGAWVDVDKNLISLVVLEMGGSSNLCSLLKQGEPVVLMGPTGEATEIPSNETICLIGGGLGNAVLFSIGKAMRDAGNQVVYLAGYRSSKDVFYADKIEEAADKVIWVSEDNLIKPNRHQDLSIKGNIIEALQSLKLYDFDRFMAIGSDGMMSAIKTYLLKENLKPNAKLIASINAPMQCMMKEVCGQCLQRHVDPITGLESYVYSCATQDQDMRSIDFSHLRQRLKQNSVQEKMTAMWLKKCMQEL